MQLLQLILCRGEDDDSVKKLSIIEELESRSKVMADVVEHSEALEAFHSLETADKGF